MKKILTILLGITLSLAINAQTFIKDECNKISEIELYVKGVNTMTDPSQMGINTMEGYVSTFIKNYGMIEYHDVLDTIERGSIVRYTQHLRGELGEKSIKEADYIDDMMAGIECSKLYFVNNGKLYVITYFIRKNNTILIEANYDSLYLFRRDDDGWKIASNLIRKDEYDEGKHMKRFDSKTTLWGKSIEYFMLENLAYGSVNKISSGSVFVTFNTEIWNFGEGYYNYNSILVLVPHDVGTYTATTFEPINKKGKIVDNVTSYDYDGLKKIWHKSVGPAEFPVLYGSRNIEYHEVDGFGLTIKYVDGTVNNPIQAGTLNFTINDNDSVSYNGTVELNPIK